MSRGFDEEDSDWNSFIDSFGSFRGAFGDPDGKRARLSSLVDIKSEGLGPIDDASDEQRVRVLVGRKGTGKTLYMRQMKDVATHSDSVRVLVEEAEQTTLLGTRHVVQVAHWFPPGMLTEIWTQLWNRALIFSLATYVLRSAQFDEYISADRRDGLEETYRRFFRSLGDQPRSAFTTVRELIQMHRTGYELTSTLDDPHWDDLERDLAVVMASAPPVYFYLDAIDEDFAHAPMYWLRCQKGLFYQVMRLLRHGSLGGRLHVVICIRDIVLSSVYRSEHAPRYRSDPHIRVLNWGPQSIRFLLGRKVDDLDRLYFDATQGKPRTFAEWVGLDSVTNRNSVREDVSNYALRHTQLIPRDVVLLGNLVGDQLVAKREQGRKMALTEAEFRTSISELARFGGLVQLQLAANQVVSDTIPVEASRYEFLDFYTASVEYSADRAEKLVEVLREMRTLRVEAKEMEWLTAIGKRDFEATDLASVLWQNGLLGYSDGRRDYFYSVDAASRFRLPRGGKEFVFHPSMVECAGLSGAGQRPIDLGA